MKTATAALPAEPLSLQRHARMVSWAARLLAAAILGQTLLFKFSGAAESREIFQTLGVEPWGRIGSGVVELVAVSLLLAPRTVALGALLAIGTMVGAIGAHFTLLGIEVAGDGGLLFSLAWITLFASGIALWLHRRQIPFLATK